MKAKFFLRQPDRWIGLVNRFSFVYAGALMQQKLFQWRSWQWV